MEKQYQYRHPRDWHWPRLFLAIWIPCFAGILVAGFVRGW